VSEYRRKKYRRGFTLFEIKLAIVVFGFVATLFVSSVVDVCKVSAGRRILTGCHEMDEAIDQWARETGQAEGNAIDVKGVERYLNTPWKTTDALGYPYVVTVVGKKQISINPLTKFSLAGVGIDWGAY
jgi:hypothetical protein